MPVNWAPFISLWFHGNVQCIQEVAAQPGGKGSARGPSCDWWATQRPRHPLLEAGSRVHGQLWVGVHQSSSCTSSPSPPTLRPGALPAAPSCQASTFQLPGLQPHLAWPGTELPPRSFPLSLPSSLQFSDPQTPASWALRFPPHYIQFPAAENTAGPM